jgi:hypothetical protein
MKNFNKKINDQYDYFLTGIKVTGLEPAKDKA